MKKEVFIVATGHSLRGFDFDRLKVKNVLCVNAAAYYCPCDYMVAIDVEFCTKRADVYWRTVEGMKKNKVITDHYVQEPHPYDIRVMLSTGAEGFEFKNNRVKGNNSGYMAINVAYHLGYRKIYLLGYDLGQDEKGNLYFYDFETPTGMVTNFNHMNFYYKTMLDDLQGSDVEIYNLSKESKLDVFPKIDLCSVL